MAFQYLKNMPLNEAVSGYLAFLEEAGCVPAEEFIAVQDALGRVSSMPIHAGISSPHYNACAMDGIAVSAESTFGATETTPVQLDPSAYEVVDTGDPLPDAFDAVVMVEDVLTDNAEDDFVTPTRTEAENGQITGTVTLLHAVAPWENIRQIGEDICAGDMLLTSGTEITPAAMGALLAGGVGTLPVWRRPVVGIIPTGDEVVPPSDNPQRGDVMEFNSTIFSGLIRQWGGEPITYPIVRDEKPLIEAAVRNAIQECDVVLIGAGSSAGRDDYTTTIISTIGELFCHGLAIKPGKPAVLGRADATPIIGIPGYPVSGIMVMETIVKPLLEWLGGRIALPAPTAVATLCRPVVSSLKYQEFIRVRMGQVDGRMVATPLPRGAGIVTSFAKADGVISVPQNREGFDAGAQVDVELLRPLSIIENALVVTGSHDPLIDELAEIVHREHPELSVASTHVGSMGAITAARRRENHCGAIHLLDEATGTYNEPYLRRYFPNGGVRLVECVYRQQGLMVAPGNPHHIRSLADLANGYAENVGEAAERPDHGRLRFVNRQKGSGTRILSDYICKQEGINPQDIYGYDHEEFTHTAVAAMVEAGSADAGMGIYSAAKMYGLDFIPVCEEQYDLLVPDYTWDVPALQALLEALASPAFAERVRELGGYRIDQPGRVRFVLMQ